MSSFKRRIVTELSVDTKGFEDLIQGHAAVCFKNLFSQSDVKPVIKGFYQAKSVWSEGFDGQQYALGDAWYHYAEEGIDFDAYSQKAEQSRKNVEKYAPGLENKLIGYLSTLASPGTLYIRDGWAGPGFMMFPAGGHVATKGGSIHYDTDAFTDEELNDPDLSMFSFVCMMQKPESGGNLTIWNKGFDRSLHRFQAYNPAEDGIVESCHIEYQLGDLWMFRGMNAHQIEPFQGGIDRICLTFHVYKSGRDWLMWF